MPTQERPDEMIGILSGDLQPRYEPNFAWKSAVASLMGLPCLRAAWPMSSLDYQNPYVKDVSGNGNHLTTYNVPPIGYENLIPTVTFNGTTQRLEKADGGAGNWADITGGEAYTEHPGLTLGGWFKPAATTANQVAMAKGTNSVNDAYWLYVQPAGTIRFLIWSGGAFFAINSTSTYTTGNWYFWAGRFIPSTSVTVFHNANSDSLAVAIPATCTDSAGAFAIGAMGGGASGHFNGKASLCFLCASALSDSAITAFYQQTRSMFGV